MGAITNKVIIEVGFAHRHPCGFPW